ncbi:MAG: outer membrane beta-barrel protein [Gemmatimonadetes bacterium]|nr:outer membrane beta-barrel protein [Gemmatimonadota bacterium]
MRRLIALVGALLLGGASAGAQVQAKMFDLGVQFGQQTFDKATALESTPFVGLSANYELPWNPLKLAAKNSSFGIGLAVDVSRPVTDGTQFPVVAFDFGDTTFLYAVSQRITLVQAGLQAVAGVPIGKGRVYGLVGTGVYAMFMDARAERHNHKVTQPMATVGGGFNYAITSSIGLSAQARAVRFTQFDRSELDPTVGYIQDRRIRDALPAPNPTSKTPTNLQYAIVFQYIPGGK